MLPPRGIILHWAGFSLERPLVMGIVNVTPDSFSDGSRRTDPKDAIAAGLAMAADGADIVDVGGESTRPGAAPVPPGVEQDRVVPAVRALAAAGLCVSVDTRNASTMAAALAAGARIVNDVSALAHDEHSPGVVAEHACPIVLMHMRGTPATMNAQAVYRDVVAEVRAELSRRVEAAVQAGVRPEQIAVDPGIGFAKQAAHSNAVLRGLPEIVSLGYPVLVGVSRKSFIGAISNEPNADRRLGGSLAAALFAVLRGASILRVHDVRETVQALRVWQTLFEQGTVPLSQHRRID
ncbi:MAG: dihydropteroate synthase [Rhodopila sp.]|jgi:dihydropteroate synthase